MGHRGWFGLWGSLLVLAVGCDVVFGLDEVRPGIDPNAYQCSCDCALGGDVRAVVLPLLHSGDDAEELVSTRAVSVTGLALEMTTGAEVQLIGLRFAAAAIPKGATIQSAHVQFTTQLQTSLATNLTIHGEATGDALRFTSQAGNVSDRERTSASVAWVPAAWNAVDQAGADQRTPDLAAVVQELVDRPDWAEGNAIGLIVSGTGKRSAWSFDGKPAAAASLRVEYTVGTPIAFALPVCMPPSLNPNIGSQPIPTDAELQDDCRFRVNEAVQQLAGACGYPTCSCSATPATLERRFVEACNGACPEETLAADCSNFDPVAGNVTATNVPGGTAVCTTHSPLASAMYGLRSRCEVTGEAGITVVDGGDTKTPDDQPAASGLVHFVGRPCPGGACEVGVEYDLELSNVTFSNFWGSRTFTGLSAVGGTLPAEGVALGAGGDGQAFAGTTANSGWGRRATEDEKLGVVGSNTEPLAVTNDWAAACTLAGAAAGTTSPEATRCAEGPTPGALCGGPDDCGPPTAEAPCTDDVCDCVETASNADMTLTLALEGDLVNQPPRANAGADLSVECNLPGAARFALDGRGSTDVDGNLADAAWFRGGRTAADRIGHGLTAVVQQGLATPASYRLRVIDGDGQADEDVVAASVVDTTAPVPSCNLPAPATITPPSAEAPARFTATAADVCDPAATAAVSGWSCYALTKGGRRVNRTDCVVTLAGDTITITDSGGVDAHIAWTATATDAQGNSASTGCEVVVVRPPPK